MPLATGCPGEWLVLFLENQLNIVSRGVYIGRRFSNANIHVFTGTQDALTFVDCIV